MSEVLAAPAKARAAWQWCVKKVPLAVDDRKS
jgi:hypothetical protein